MSCHESPRTIVYLEKVTMLVPGDEVERGASRITYVFIADRRLGPLRWWDWGFVALDAETGRITQWDEYLWQTHSHRMPAFHIESAVLDSSDALRMAQELGGKAYCERHPNAQVSVIGSCGLFGKGEIFWGVGYFRPPEVLYAELKYGIEARTGEVRGDAFRPPFLPGPDPLQSG